MNNKRFLCLFIAVVVCVQALCFSVFAASDHGLPSNIVNIIIQTEAYKKHCDDYKVGKISEEELQEYTKQYVFSTGCSVVGGSAGYTFICSALNSLGVDTDEYWDMFYRGKTGSSGDPDFDMQGCGAALYIPDYGGHEYCIVYMSWGEFYYEGDQLYYRTHGVCKRTIKSYGGSPQTSDYNQEGFNKFDSNCKYYGDWRYTDGSTADDKTTDINYTIPPLEEQDDDTLSDFLDELIKQLKYEHPDLSTIEGLLAAVHSELKLLDHDDDTSLLSTINNSILSLKTSIENLKIEGTENNFDFSNLFGDLNFKDLVKDNKLVVDIDLSDILSGNKIFSDNALNFYFKVEDDYASTKFTELKDKFDSKFSFIETLKDRRDFYFNEFKKLWSENENSEEV